MAGNNVRTASPPGKSLLRIRQLPVTEAIVSPGIGAVDGTHVAVSSNVEDGVCLQIFTSTNVSAICDPLSGKQFRHIKPLFGI